MEKGSILVFGFSGKIVITVIMPRLKKINNSLFRVLTFGSFNEKILKVNPVNYFMYYIIMGSPEISDEMIS